jgi:hypothetical protein
MRIASVKTADGPIYFSIARDSGKYAAVRTAIEQLAFHANEVFDIEDQNEADAIIRLIEKSGDHYKTAMTEGYIHEHTLIER